MIRFLHAADFHMDAPLTKLSDPRKAHMLRAETRGVFLSAVEEARRMEADIVLLAGDLFDRSYATRQTLAAMAEAIDSLPDTRFFISPGNHDPIGADSPYQTFHWPRNLHIFGEGVTGFDLPDQNLTVYGSGFTHSAKRTRVLKNFRPRNLQRVNIMVLHGELVGEGSASDYGPVTLSDIQNSGLDYLALGHIHTRTAAPLRAGRTVYAYPGTPQGHGYDETGIKGAIAGIIDPGGKDEIRLSFVPLGKRRFETFEVDVSFASSLAEIAGQMRAAAGDLLQNHFIRFVAKGQLSPEVVLSENVLKLAFSDAFDVSFRDYTTLHRDLDALAGEGTLMGCFVSRLLKQTAEVSEAFADGEESDDNRQRRVAQAALHIGLAALTGEAVEL
jgi:exonuclease SbcD